MSGTSLKQQLPEAVPQPGSMAAFKGVLKEISNVAFQQGPSPTDIIKQYAAGGLKLTTPEAIGGAISMDTGSRAGTIADMFEDTLNFALEQQKKVKEQFDLSLKQLDLASVSGVALTSQTLNNIDTALGIPGVAQAYLTTKQNVLSAQTEQQQMSAAMDTLKFLNAMPTGFKMKIGDTEYTGLGGDINKVYKEVDGNGKVTFLEVGPGADGQGLEVLSSATGGPVAKGFKGSSSPKSTPQPTTKFDKFVQEKQEEVGISFNLADPKVKQGLEAMMLLSPTDKKKMYGNNLDPNDPIDVLKYIQEYNKIDSGLNFDDL